MSDFENPMDKIMREARERGEFDNLPGKGKPFNWEDESMVPEDQRMANRLLKHNNFTLDWIEMGKELDAEYTRLVDDYRAAQTARSQGRLPETGWREARDLFEKKVDDLNRRVIGYNLRVPGDQFIRRPYPKELS
jgi:DnaJ family protein C protein 28